MNRRAFFKLALAAPLAPAGIKLLKPSPKPKLDLQALLNEIYLLEMERMKNGNLFLAEIEAIDMAYRQVWRQVAPADTYT